MKSSFRLLCEDRFSQVGAEAVVMLLRQWSLLEVMVAWVLRGDKSGGGEERAELMISCGGGLAKGWLLEGRKGAINDEV